MKIQQLLNPKVGQSLKKILDSKLPIQTSMKIRQLVKEIDAILLEYEATRQEVLTKYADKNEAGDRVILENGNVSVSEENLKLYTAELAPIQSEEVELPAISVNLLAGKVDITPSELIDLDSLITE